MCKEIPIKVEFEGTYNAIATFLDQMSKLERIVNMKSVEMKPKGKKVTAEGAKKLAIKTMIVTYMFAGVGSTASKGGKKKRK